MPEKAKISYDARNNMLEVTPEGSTTTEKLPVIPETFMRYGCDQVLEHFRKDHPVWADDFDKLLRDAIQGSRGIQMAINDDDTYEQMKAIQLSAFINIKYLVFVNQIQQGIKPDLGRK